MRSVEPREAIVDETRVGIGIVDVAIVKKRRLRKAQRSLLEHASDEIVLLEAGELAPLAGGLDEGGLHLSQAIGCENAPRDADAAAVGADLGLGGVRLAQGAVFRVVAVFQLLEHVHTTHDGEFVTVQRRASVGDIHHLSDLAVEWRLTVVGFEHDGVAVILQELLDLGCADHAYATPVKDITMETSAVASLSRTS